MPEFHQLLHGHAMLADFTADRELHPAPKVMYEVIFIIAYFARESRSERLSFYFLLHGHALRQITRLIYIAATRQRCIIGQKLQRQHSHERRQILIRARNIDNMIRILR